jgi:hypothetical protein
VPTGAIHVFGDHAPYGLPAHEFDVYIGIFGTILVALFGIAPIARRLGPVSAAESWFAPWQVPLLLLALLSCWRFYGALVPARVGWLTVERVPSRFLGIALAFVVVMACSRFDAWWRSQPRSAGEQGFLWGAIAMLGGQLLYHSWTFSPARSHAFAVTLSPIAPTIAAASSSAYVAGIVIGALVTVASAAAAWVWPGLYPLRR